MEKENKKQSPGAEQEKELNSRSIPQEVETEAQQDARSLHFRRLLQARDDREMPRRDFDGMTYTQDYQANIDAANTYLSPKKNDDEVRVNTSTSEKKIDVIDNELAAMNIQPEVLSFDQHDMEVVGLGKDMEQIVFRTNQIEKDADEWDDIRRELLTQRIVYVEEAVIERKVKNSTFTIRRAEKRVIPGTKVYPGNLRIPAHRFREQPFFFTVELVDYDYLKTIWGENKAFDLVKPGGTASTSVDDTNLYDFRISSVDDRQCEVITYRSYVDNELQVYIGGVAMHPPGTTLDYDHEGYRLAAVVVKTIRRNFIYGKPPIASAKTLQGLENETLRNLIRKFRQALEPPIGTTATQIFSRNIWSAGAVTQGVTKNMFEKLIDHDGVTQSEMAMMKLIEDQTQKFIGVSDLQQGQDSGGEKTATQTMKELEQSIKMLGQVVGAMMRLVRDLTLLRIFSIVEQYTKPVGKLLVPGTTEILNKYQEFTINNVDVGGGRRGKKIIKFTNFDLTPEQEQAIYDKEQEHANQGEVVKIRTINAEKLSSFPLFWYVVSTNKEKAGSAINKLLYREKIAQATEVQVQSQGQVMVNWNKAAEGLELVWADRDLFEKSAPNQLNEQPPEDSGVANEAKDMLSKLEGEQAATSNTGIGAQLTEAPRSQVRLNPTNLANGQQG